MYKIMNENTVIYAVFEVFTALKIISWMKSHWRWENVVHRNGGVFPHGITIRKTTTWILCTVTWILFDTALKNASNNLLTVVSECW